MHRCKIQFSGVSSAAVSTNNIFLRSFKCTASGVTLLKQYNTAKYLDLFRSFLLYRLVLYFYFTLIFLRLIIMGFSVSLLIHFKFSFEYSMTRQN